MLLLRSAIFHRPPPASACSGGGSTSIDLAGMLLANLIVMSGTIMGRAMLQAYRKPIFSLVPGACIPRLPDWSSSYSSHTPCNLAITAYKKKIMPMLYVALLGQFIYMTYDSQKIFSGDWKTNFAR
ncbi:unnamed protein product [Urochloa humidicola]